MNSKKFSPAQIKFLKTVLRSEVNGACTISVAGEDDDRRVSQPLYRAGMIAMYRNPVSGNIKWTLTDSGRSAITA